MRENPRRRRSARVLALCGALALAACSALEPRLDPHDPPPNLPVGSLLLTVPQRAVDALADRRVVDELDLALEGAMARIGGDALAPGHDALILAHQVVVGMPVREVIWCFVAHPSRVRDQGPPGGHTLLWEPIGLHHDRYWVRFDAQGLAVAAGTW